MYLDCLTDAPVGLWRGDKGIGTPCIDVNNIYNSLGYLINLKPIIRYLSGSANIVSTFGVLKTTIIGKRCRILIRKINTQQGFRSYLPSAHYQGAV